MIKPLVFEFTTPQIKLKSAFLVSYFLKNQVNNQVLRCVDVSFNCQNNKKGLFFLLYIKNKGVEIII